MTRNERRRLAAAIAEARRQKVFAETLSLHMDKLRRDQLQAASEAITWELHYNAMRELVDRHGLDVPDIMPGPVDWTDLRAEVAEMGPVVSDVGPAVLAELKDRFQRVMQRYPVWPVNVDHSGGSSQ